VARAIVRGIERRQSYILPGLEARLSFLLADGLGGLLRWYFDRLVARARREREAQT
jgi:hypothetical protein